MLGFFIFGEFMKTHLIYLSIISFLSWSLYISIKNQSPDMSFTIKQTFTAEKILVKFKEKNQIDYMEIFKPNFNSTEFFGFNKKTSSNSIGLGLSSNYLFLEHSFILKNLHLGLMLNLNNFFIVRNSDLYIKYIYEY